MFRTSNRWERRENEYDLVITIARAARFETYSDMKNYISHRGSIAWNLLDPSVASTRAYAKMPINSQALKLSISLLNHPK